MNHLGRVVVTVVAAGALISGCGGGPPLAGNAAFIGDQAVPLGDIQTQTRNVLEQVGGPAALEQYGQDPTGVSRDLLSQALGHQLITQKAAELGVEISDQQVDELIAAQGGADAMLAGNTGDLAMVRSTIRDQLSLTEIGRRVAPNLTVTVALVDAGPDAAKATAAARAMATGGPALENLLATQDVQQATYQAGTFPEDLASVVIGLPEGTAGTVPTGPDGESWVAFRVVKRDSVNPAPVPAQISEQEAIVVGFREAQFSGERQGIKVNPRFGKWDAAQLSVVPASTPTGEIILPTAP